MTRGLRRADSHGAEAAVVWDAGGAGLVPVGRLLLEQDPSVRAPRALLRVAGELDVATTPTLREALVGLVDGGYQHLDVDVRCVPFSDSSGLYALLDARRRLGRRGGTLELHHPCRSLCLLLDLFELTPTLDPVEP